MDIRADTVGFFTEYRRMCDSFGLNCGDCPIYSLLKDSPYNTCREIIVNNPSKSIELVEAWAREHPCKTFKDDFFERFPNARRDKDGLPLGCCVQNLYDIDINCDDNFTECSECWNKPILP